jgi:hypothetical protein
MDYQVKQSKLIHAILGFLLFSLIIFLRRPDAFLNPQFWAEDGVIFFKECYYYNLTSALTPYAGYLHFIPRIIALISNKVIGVRLAPFFYNTCTLIIYIAVIANVYSRRVNLNNKILYILSLCLVPCYGNEIFMNVTNIQWFTGILIIVILIKREPSSQFGNIPLQWVSDIIQLLLAGLTGPFIVILIPLYAIRLYIQKNIHSLVVGAVAGITSIIQLGFLLTTSSEAANCGISVHYIINFIEYKVTYQYFFGWLNYSDKYSYIYLMAYISLITYLLKLIYSSKNRNSLIFISCHFLFIGATLIRMKGDPVIFNIIGGNRYLYIPYVMLSWVLISELNKSNRVFIYSLLMIILSSSLTSKFTTKYIDYNWKTHAEKIGKENIEIPINPPGWSVILKK